MADRLTGLRSARAPTGTGKATKPPSSLDRPLHQPAQIAGADDQPSLMGDHDARFDPELIECEHTAPMLDLGPAAHKACVVPGLLRHARVAPSSAMPGFNELYLTYILDDCAAEPSTDIALLRGIECFSGPISICFMGYLEPAMKLKIYTGAEARDLRHKLRLNQTEFWSHFQTTQSGGSRYESGREIPDPVQALLNIAFSSEAKSTAIVGDLREFGRPKKRAKATAAKAK